MVAGHGAGRLDLQMHFLKRTDERRKDKMIAYKGFNKDLTCRGFQYEIGKTYEEPKAVLCECGFHACKEVLDVFSYYPPNESRYCVVDIDDISEIKIGDSKICGAKITILREITIDEICRIAYDQNAENQSIKSENSGDWSVASNSGERSVASNSGNRSAAITLLSESKSQVSNNSVAISLGRNGLASGDIGCFIVLAETINEKIVDVKAAKVDGQNIKANVLYKLENGKFVES